MDGFFILTTRKRILIALIHTIVFLGVATIGLFTTVSPLRMSSPVAAWLIAGIYFVVSSILIWLVAISGTAAERCYFGLCATSASFGLLRQTVGDPPMHVAVYVRIAMLGGAVFMGMWLLRSATASIAALPLPPDGAPE